MSADDTVAIAEFPDGFRVTHCQAVENIDYYKKGTKKWHDEIDEYFGESEVYKSKKGVMKEAFKIEKEVIKEFGFTEYGICDLGFFDHKFKK